VPEDHTTECWQAVEGWEGLYDISCRGRVYSRFLKRPMQPALAGAGYPSVRLCDGVRRWRPYVHQLVARAFLGEIPLGYEPNHRNGNKTDNSVGNLEWLTHSDNLKHAVATGLFTPPPPPKRRKAG
jgi:hypothetical protein